MIEDEINVVDIIISYVNANFLDGASVNQVKNFKNLTDFINKNGLPSELEIDEYEKLLSNEKIVKMISTLLKLKDNSLYLQNPLFYSLSLMYSNNNGIKLDLDSQFENDNFIDNEESEENYKTPVLTDNVKAYLKELVYEPFTVEEEIEMFKRYSSGEVDLRDTIINHNLRLVVNVAKKYNNSRMELLDLIQAGNIGLSVAVDRYDYKTGNKFSTYATWWIKQSITHYIADNCRTIRIPVHMYDILYKIEKYIRNYELMHDGNIPSNEEISKELDIDIEKVETVLNFKPVVSLNSFVGSDDERDSELGDFIEDKDSIDLDNSIYYEEFRNTIFNSDILTEKEKYVVMYRFGFVDGIRYRHVDIAKMLKITRERVKQIESKALLKLRFSNNIKQFDPRR